MVQIYVAQAPWIYGAIPPEVAAAVESFGISNCFDPSKLRFILFCPFSPSSTAEIGILAGSAVRASIFDPYRFDVHHWRCNELQADMAIVVAC